MPSGHTPQGADVTDEGHLVRNIVNEVGTCCAVSQTGGLASGLYVEGGASMSSGHTPQGPMFRTRGTSSLPGIV